MVNRLIRTGNLFSNAYSYLMSSLSGKPVTYGMPLALGAELTNNCNLRCPECAAGSGLMTRPRGYMDITLFEKVLSELRPYLFQVNLYFQGEPMLHNSFPAFIYACGKIKTVMATNGHYLTEENSEKLVRSGLRKLIVAVDGTSQEIYSAYRVNGDLKIVTEGIRILSEIKKKLRSALLIEIQFLVNRMNEHQIPEVKKLAEGLKVSLRFKSMQIISMKDMFPWLPAEEKYRRYSSTNRGYVIKSSLPDRCARLWFNPVITWDGKVLPCCFDKNSDHIMGDITEESFRDIWEGPKYRLFRRELLSGRSTIDMCRNCTSGLKGVIT